MTVIYNNILHDVIGYNSLHDYLRIRRNGEPEAPIRRIRTSRVVGLTEEMRIQLGIPQGRGRALFRTARWAPRGVRAPETFFADDPIITTGE